MTTTISLPHQVNFYQWDNPNEVGLETGTLGGATVQTNEYALFMIGANETLINTGAILNGNGAAIGVRNGSSTIINQVGGTIEAFAAGGDGIYSYDAVSITNSGFIGSGGGATGDSSDAISIRGGFVSNTSTGTLTGSGVYMNGYGVVINAGKIFGDSIYGGVALGVGGIVTNLSGGYIAANGAGYGVQIKGGGTVTNGGEINGGTGYAVKLGTGATNKVIVDSTGVFIGTVSGGTAADATLELASAASKGTLSGFGSQFVNFGTLDFAPSSTWLVQTNTNISSTVVDGFVQGDTIDITGFTAVNVGAVGGGTSVTLTNSGGTHLVVDLGEPAGNVTIASGAGISGTEITTICFCRGTLILTPNGDIPVEQLSIGDRVVTLGYNNSRVITWIGRGKVLATRGQRGVATPVIVHKDALAPNVPNRDLHVTKAHALYIDGVLIPVEFLVNHKSIVWDDRAQEVEIYHVELESHDVLIANGAPAESFRDDGNRWLFQNAHTGLGLPPQEPYAPVLTGGPVVDEIWERLRDRAGPRDLPPLTEDPDLHLVVDGARVDTQECQDSIYIFQVPPGAKTVAIVSREAVPAELGIARDARSLGVALRKIAIRHGTKFVLFNADDARLTSGFHAYEPTERLRWTNGCADLPADTFAHFDKGAEVMLHLGGKTRYPDDQTHPDRAAA